MEPVIIGSKNYLFILFFNIGLLNFLFSEKTFDFKI
jgi:hypothetical protein